MGIAPSLPQRRELSSPMAEHGESAGLQPSLTPRGVGRRLTTTSACVDSTRTCQFTAPSNPPNPPNPPAPPQAPPPCDAHAVRFNPGTPDDSGGHATLAEYELDLDLAAMSAPAGMYKVSCKMYITPDFVSDNDQPLLCCIPKFASSQTARDRTIWLTGPQLARLTRACATSGWTPPQTYRTRLSKGRRRVPGFTWGTPSPTLTATYRSPTSS